MVSALTYHFNEIKNEIVTDVTAKNGVGTQTVTTKGLWDTGAQNSAITKKAAQTLGLIGLKKANVRGVHGTQEVNVYFIEIILNNPNITVKCLVTECDELSNDAKEKAIDSFRYNGSCLNWQDEAINTIKKIVFKTFLRLLNPP